MYNDQAAPWMDSFSYVETEVDLDWVDRQQNGAGAVLHQSELMQNVEKLDEVYQYRGKAIRSPLMQYLSIILKQKTKRVPKTFGLVHRKSQTEIDSSSHNLTEEYVDAFSKGLKLSTQLRKLNLS
jgi:hypothetical protein